MTDTRPGSPRRAPRADERRRDADRTRAALLDAAAAEFAEKGRAGARTADIAARAGVNKQLISYHFGGKDGLYAALAERWLQQEAEWEAEGLPLDELVLRYLGASVTDRDVTRIFLRECLDDVAPPAAGPEEVADLERRREAGELAADLDPRFVLLALQGMASAGLLFGADIRATTGLDPASPAFVEAYGEQLRRIVRRLALPLPERD